MINKINNKGFTPLEICMHVNGQKRPKVLFWYKFKRKSNCSSFNKSRGGKFLTGFTLIEMIVAVTVFTLVVSAASGLFISGLRAQRQSLASQSLLDQTSYLMEYMSRTLRMAKKDMDGICTGTEKLNYKFINQCLKFKNYKYECQQFCLDGKRLKDEKGDYLTSEDLKIENFNVNFVGQTQDDDLQPQVTIFLDIEGKERSKIKIQTTISQRDPDVQY